jgi:hypothetical protein
MGFATAHRRRNAKDAASVVGVLERTGAEPSPFAERRGPAYPASGSLRRPVVLLFEHPGEVMRIVCGLRGLGSDDHSSELQWRALRRLIA